MMFGFKPKLHFLMSKSMRASNDESESPDSSTTPGAMKLAPFVSFQARKNPFPQHGKHWQQSDVCQVAVAQEAKNLEKFLGDMEANIKAVTPRFVCVHVQSVLIKVAKVVGLRVDGPFFGNLFWFELHCGHALFLCWVQVFKNSFEAFKRGGKGLLATFSMATWPNPSGCVEHHD